MSDKTTRETHDAGQPLGAAGKGHTGEMESDGQPVQLPAAAGDLSASTDGTAEREREAKLAKDGSGF